jgi:hypothetical protein
MTSRYRITTMVLAAALALSAPSLSANPDGAAGPSASATSAAPTLVAPMARLWTAVAATGKVHTLPAGLDDHEWIRVSRGQTVEPLSLLRTGGRGRATLARHGDVILVDPRSELLLPDLTPRSRIHQRSGSARYEVSGRSDDHFEVVTPYLVAGVKGTVFNVTVQDDFAAVSVAEGSVQVRSLQSGEVHDLFAGDLALVDAHEGVLEIRRDAAGEELGERPSRQARRARKDAERLARRSADDGVGRDVVFAGTDGSDEGDTAVDMSRKRLGDDHGFEDLGLEDDLSLDDDGLEEELATEELEDDLRNDLEDEKQNEDGSVRRERHQDPANTTPSR